MPASIEQACILFCVAEALTRGATTTTIHDIGGHAQSTGGDVAGLTAEAELLCHPFRRYHIEKQHCPHSHCATLRSMATCTAIEDCEKPVFPARLVLDALRALEEEYGDFTTVKKPGKPRQLGDCRMDDCDAAVHRPRNVHQALHPLAEVGRPARSRSSIVTGLEDRFWAKVNKNGPVPDYDPSLGPCWIWTAASRKGTGPSIWTAGRSNLTGSPISGSSARFPRNANSTTYAASAACCNPAHLEPVSHLINVHRGTLAVGHTMPAHCRRSLDEENTYRHSGSALPE